MRNSLFQIVEFVVVFLVVSSELFDQRPNNNNDQYVKDKDEKEFELPMW